MQTCWLVMLTFVVLAASQDARATDFVWNNPAGGGYLDAGNWTPPDGPPGSVDRAVLDGAPAGAITFGADTATHSLAVAAAGGPVTLDLSGKRLELMNYSRVVPYANWAWVCQANSSLVVTSSAAGGTVDGLDERGDASALNNSASVYVDAGAALALRGSGTTVKLLSARVEAGGQMRVGGGADVVLGQDKARAMSTYLGNDPDDVALLIDGATYIDVQRDLVNCTMLVTNGGKVNNYREAYVGRNGNTGKLIISGNGSESSEAGTPYAAYGIRFGGTDSRGYGLVSGGGLLANSDCFIAHGDRAFGQLIVSGAGSRLGRSSGTNLRICDGNYLNATGILCVADESLALLRWVRLGAGGTLRLDNGTVQAIWGNATDRISYNRGGRIEGTGTVINTATSGEEVLENAAGGVIAPGLPIGNLTIEGWGKGGAGAFTNALDGIIEIDLAGSESHDRLAFVNCRVHLGGTLAVMLRDGYVPAIGEQFDILDFDPAKCHGTFDILLLPRLSEGRWVTDNLLVDGTISVAEAEERDPQTFFWNSVWGADFAIDTFWTPAGGPPLAEDMAVLTGVLQSPITQSYMNEMDTLQFSNVVATLDLGGQDLRVHNDAVGEAGAHWGIYGHSGSLRVENRAAAAATLGGGDGSSGARPGLYLAPEALLVLGANASLSAARARVDGGRLDLQGGVLTTMDSDALTLNDGKLTGTGWIESLAAGGGAVVNNGQLAPGLHGTLRFAGFSTVSNTPAGEMAFIIQTSVAGATNNLIAVTDGQLVLGGTLRVALDVVSNDLPPGGATFKLLDWNSCSGAFDAIILPERGLWSTNNLYVDGTITSLPYELPADYRLYTWTNAVGGDYMAGGNWAPHGPPGTNDTARLSSATQGPVYLSNPRLTNHTLQVTGAPVTLDLNGRSLPLLNFYSGTTYANWGFVCGPGARLTITNSGSAAAIGTLGASLDASANLYIDAQADLDVAGVDTRLTGAHLRIHDGHLGISGGAKAVFGSDPVRSTVTLNGSDTLAQAPLMTIDGEDSLFDGVSLWVNNGAVVVTNGGTLTTLRALNLGLEGGARGGIIFSGAATTGNTISTMSLRNGYCRIENGAMIQTLATIGFGAGSMGELVITGAGSVLNGSYLEICRTRFDLYYPGAQGSMVIADGGHANIRYFLMQTNGLIRLDTGTVSVLYTGYDNRCLMQGGRLEGVGRIRNTGTGDRWFVNDGGVIAPGLPGGALELAGWHYLVNRPQGAIEFQIGGDEAGEYGRLVLDQSALQIEGGTLRIALADGYHPVRRTTYHLFEVVSGASMSGAFDAVELPARGTWLLDNLYVDGSVTLIPDTGTVLFLR